MSKTKIPDSVIDQAKQAGDWLYFQGKQATKDRLDRKRIEQKSDVINRAQQKSQQQRVAELLAQNMNSGAPSAQDRREMRLTAAKGLEERAKQQYEGYKNSEQRKTDWDKAIRDAVMEMPAAGSSLDLALGKLPEKTINQTEAQHEAVADYFEQNRKAVQDTNTMGKDVEEVAQMSDEDRRLLETYAYGRNEWFDHQRIADSVSARAELEKKYGKQKVEELAESWQRYQNAVSAEKNRQQTQEGAGSGFFAGVGHSTASVAANALGTLTAPFGYLQEAFGRTGRYQTLDPNNAGAMPGQYASAVRGAVSEDMGTAGKVLYQGTMSALDNLTRIAMGGGTAAGSLGLAALGSFGSTLSEASAQGATPGQAVGKAVLSAGIEVATEKVPLDELFKAGKSGYKGAAAAFRQALKQGGIEAAEEEIALLGNVLVDALVMREKSDYNQQIGKLVAGGMSYQDAKNQADRQLWDEAVNTAFTSWISGGVMSGAQSGAQYAGHQMQEWEQMRSDLASQIQDMMTRENAGNATQNAAVAENATTEKPKTVTDEQIREAMNELYPREQTGQERMAQLEAEMDRMIDGNELTTEEGQNRYQTLAQEWNNLRDQEDAESAGRADSLEGEEAPPERATPEYTGANERISGNPLAGRTEESVGSRSVKAYQYENPEVKPYFQDAARGILSDINNSMPGQRTFDEEMHYQSGGEKGWSGNKRVTTDDLAEIKDAYGYSWDQLREAAEDIIHDRGRENNAASKRLEFLIHDRLANGYTDVEGRPMPANREYLDFLEERQINEYRREGLGDLVANADRYAPQGAGEGFEAMGAADYNFSPYTRMQNEYGNIPEGENAVRPDDAPISTDGTDRVSYTARTAIGAQATPDEFVPLIENEVVRGGFSFIPITNDQTTQNAVRTIQAEGWQTARANWTAAVRQGRAGADITAQGALLYNHAVNSGNYQEAMDILLDYQQAVRNSARGLQAARILKRLTPENRLYMIRRSIQRMVEDMHLDREITIDEDLARRYQETRDNAEADRILDEIARDVARQIPSTFAERFTALRYLNMLGNFRTQVRNWVGNVTNEGLYLAKDELAATIEGLASFASGGRIQRSKTLVRDRGTRQAAAADYENVADWISGGGRANDRGGESDDFARRVQENRRIFRNPLLEGYRNATNWAMNNDRFGDAAFGRANYARAMAGYLNARGIRTNDLSTVDRETLNAAREYAVRQAQEATFRDNNQVSEFVSRALRGRDTPAWARVIGEAVMPFRKTPANVLVRAEEFSPLGLINSAVNTVRAARGDISGAELVDSWAKSITGTGLFAIGWALANMGYLRGGPDEDEDKAAFDKLNGMQDYALMLPDGTNLTIDAFSPTALPLLLGAQLDKVLDGSDLTFADLEGMLSTLSDPMIEMSMLSGLNDTIDAIRYADNSLGQFFVNAGFNYLTQALGNTLFGQIERSTEESRMTTYIDKDSNIPAWLQRNLGKLSQKIPLWDYNQTEYIDQWGREQKNPEGIKNWLYNLLSPSYIDKAEMDAVAEELYRLHEITGENVFPQIPETTISYTDSDGNRHEKYNLSAEEADKLKRVQGQTHAKLVADLVGSEDFSALTDDQKAKAAILCRDYARELARGEVLPGYDGKSSWMEGIEGKEAAAIIGKVTGGELSDAMTALATSWREGYADDSGALEGLESAAKTYEALTPEMQKAVKEGLSGRVAAYLEARAKGMDTDTFANLYRKYWDIDQSGAGASEQAAKWAYELERAMERREITAQQKAAMKSSLRFYQNFPAETEKFDQLTEGGLSADEAQDLGWLIQGLKIQEGYKDVRPVQKAEAIAGSSLSEADKIAALKIYGTDAQDEKLDMMLDAGYSAKDYVSAWLIYSREDAKGGKGTKNRTIEAFMQKFNVDRATAAAIYDIYG